MSDIIMTVFAVLFIIALVGLFIALFSTYSSVMEIVNAGKRAAKMVDKPKAAGTRLANNAKRVAFRARDHAVIIASHAKKGVASVSHIKDHVTIIASAFKSG